MQHGKRAGIKVAAFSLRLSLEPKWMRDTTAGFQQKTEKIYLTKLSFTLFECPKDIRAVWWLKKNKLTYLFTPCFLIFATTTFKISY